MKQEEKPMKTTLREYLHAINLMQEDRDVYIDGVDGIAVCPPICMSEEALEAYKNILDVECELLEGSTLSYEDCPGDLDEEHEETDAERAWDVICNLAGYGIGEERYNRYFPEDGTPL